MNQAASYTTRSGINITRRRVEVDYDEEIVQLAETLDSHLGCLLSSSYEYPNRYKRWDLGLVDPMLTICSRGYEVSIRALNQRGQLVQKVIAEALKGQDYIERFVEDDNEITLTV